jgi:hypothetical protein
VSWQAQSVMVSAVKWSALIAAIEACNPDAGALVFAGLGIALAIHGQPRIAARSLHVACVAISLTMNAMAAGRGWRDVATWVMPAAIHALAGDTPIGVVPAWSLARMVMPQDHMIGHTTDKKPPTCGRSAGCGDGDRRQFRRAGRGRREGRPLRTPRYGSGLGVHARVRVPASDRKPGHGFYILTRGLGLSSGS